MFYCFPLANVLLHMDPQKGGRMCVCVLGDGVGRRREEDSVIYVICIFSPKRISCSFSRYI